MSNQYVVLIQYHMSPVIEKFKNSFFKSQADCPVQASHLEGPGGSAISPVQKLLWESGDRAVETARKSQRGRGIGKHGKYLPPALKYQRVHCNGPPSLFHHETSSDLAPETCGSSPCVSAVAVPGVGGRLLHHKRQLCCPGSAFLGLWGQTPLTFSAGCALPDTASGQPPWGSRQAHSLSGLRTQHRVFRQLPPSEAVLRVV